VLKVAFNQIVKCGSPCSGTSRIRNVGQKATAFKPESHEKGREEQERRENLKELENRQ